MKKIKFCIYCVIGIYLICLITCSIIYNVGSLPSTFLNTIIMLIPFSIIAGIFAAIILGFGSLEDDGGPAGPMSYL